MLNNNEVQVRNVLNTTGTSAQAESIIAVALAYCAPLPPQKDVSLDIFYIHNVMTKVTDVLDDINEQMVIDISSAAAMAKDAWMNRVSAVYSPLTPQCAAIAGWVPASASAYCSIKELICPEFPKVA